MITSSPAQRSQTPRQRTHCSTSQSRSRSPYSPTSFRTTASASSSSCSSTPQHPRASFHGRSQPSPKSLPQASAATIVSATAPIGPRPAPRRTSVVYYRDQGTQFPVPREPSPSAHPTPKHRPLSSSTSSSAHQTNPDPVPATAAPPPTAQTETSPTSDAVSKLAAGGVQPEPSEPRLRQTPQTSSSAASNVGDSRKQLAEAEVPSTATKVTPSSSGTHKRPRTSTSPEEQKIMPTDYSECDPKKLAELISNLLMDLISYNDRIPLKDGHLTRFHSRAPPGISVHDYLQRITFHALLPPPILLSMVYYIDKLSALYSHFTINSLTVHRFLITAATVASKGLSDSFWTNNTYARVGGVSIRELALLELELLTRMDWQIVPQNSRLKEYYVNLVERTPDYRLADAPPAIDSSTAPAADVASTQSSDDIPSSSEDRDTPMAET